MIIQRAILLIIATFVRPTHQTELKYISRNAIINWQECEILLKCYCYNGVPKTVRNANGEIQVIHELKPPAAVNIANDQTPVGEEGLCNIGFHMKYINHKIAVIQLQMFWENDPGNEPELMLYTASNDEYFGCKYNRKTRKFIFKGDKNLARNYDISLFDDLSRIEEGFVLCAIKIGDASVFAREPIENDFRQSDNLKLNPYMKLTKSQKYEFQEGGKAIFVKRQMYYNCDTYSFHDYSGEISSIIRSLMYRDKNKLSCENYGPIYKMKYFTSKNKTASDMKRLECGPDALSYDKKYLSIIKDDGIDENGEPKEISTEVPDLHDYTIYCDADFSKVCEDPIDHGQCTGNTCPIFSQGNATHPALLTCPGKKWFINNEYYVLNEEPSCNQDTIMDMNKAVFSLSLNTGKAVNLSKAQCFEEYDCLTRSKIHIPKCDIEKDLKRQKCLAGNETTIRETGILKCNDENAVLTVSGEQQTTLNTWKSYTCNKKTGLFYNSTTEVPRFSRITCLGSRQDKYEDEGLSDSAKYGIMAAIAVGIIALILLAAYCVIRWLKNSHMADVKGKRAWKKLKKSEKIEACIKAFREKVMLANSSTADNIFAGLDMMEVLLETETAHPECWAEVIPFLMRFQGSIVKIDHGVWHLFSRYMYLQAAKIIEKHGWLTDKPIRKKKPKGLIRSVAIHLLSFAIYDPLNPCAEELVQTGFQKLGWKAVEQYPHCGQMWALIMHAPPIAFKKDDDTKKFDAWKFRDTLKQIMNQKGANEQQYSIPKEETIPAFGSIAEQAAYALGASPFPQFHYDVSRMQTTEPVNPEEGRVPAAYFRGFAESPLRNPAMMIIAAYKMWPTVEEKIMKKLKAAIPKDALEESLQNAMKLVTYYGRALDAKRLHTRFLPAVPETEVDSWQEQQEAFEEAMENKKDALRKWFAKRTDLEELKKKPVYTKSGKVVLDNRIRGEEVKNVKGGTNSGSNTASGSEEKDPASPAAPPEVAAGVDVTAPSPPPPPAAAAAAAPAAAATPPPPAAAEAAAPAAVATPPVAAATPPSAPAKK